MKKFLLAVSFFLTAFFLSSDIVLCQVTYDGVTYNCNIYYDEYHDETSRYVYCESSNTIKADYYCNMYLPSNFVYDTCNFYDYTECYKYYSGYLNNLYYTSSINNCPSSNSYKSVYISISEYIASYVVSSIERYKFISVYNLTYTHDNGQYFQIVIPYEKPISDTKFFSTGRGWLSHGSGVFKDMGSKRFGK